MRNTETISPAGLSWERTSFYHWYLLRSGKTVGSVYWNNTGYSILAHYIQTDNTRYNTLD